MFDHWAVAPIPVLEMLQGHASRFDDLTIDQAKGRLKMHSEARWQFERIVNNVSLEELEQISSSLPAEIVVIANLVRSSLQQCESFSHTNQFRFALHDLMVRTLPFLSGIQASELVKVAASSVCDDEDHFAATDWLNLYRAVAERDPGGMLDAGRAVLALQEEYPPVLREYALASALLGAITMDSGDDAADLWRHFGDVLYADSRPPEYVRLLSSIAMH